MMFHRSADVAALLDRLLAVPVGARVTWGDLSDTLGRDAQTRRHLVYAAMRIALREHGAVFASIRDVGYQRLEPKLAVREIGYVSRRGIARRARRASRALTYASRGLNDLAPIEQRRLAAEMSAFGLIEHLCQEKTVTPKEDAPLKPMPVAVAARRLILGEDA